jgi:hypothetical protein
MAPHSKFFQDSFRKIRGQARQAAQQAAALRANRDLKPEAVSRQAAALQAAPALNALGLARQIREAHAAKRAEIAAMKPTRTMSPIELARATRWLDQIVNSGDIGKIREAARDPAFRAVAALLATPSDLGELQRQLANASDVPPTTSWYAEVVRQDHPKAADSAFEEADRLADLARQCAYLATALPGATDAAAVVDQVGDDVDPAALKLDEQARAWHQHLTGEQSLHGAEITLNVAEQSLVARITAAQPAPAPAPVLTGNGAPIGGDQ